MRAIEEMRNLLPVLRKYRNFQPDLWVGKDQYRRIFCIIERVRKLDSEVYGDSYGLDARLGYDQEAFRRLFSNLTWDCDNEFKFQKTHKRIVEELAEYVEVVVKNYEGVAKDEHLQGEVDRLNRENQMLKNELEKLRQREETYLSLLNKISLLEGEKL